MCVFNRNESTAPSRKDAHASTKPGKQSCVRALPTPLKRPSGTATQQVLEKDGTTSLWPSKNQPWTPSAIESGRRQTDLKLALPNSSQQLQRSGQHCSRAFDYTLFALRKARNDVQRIARRCANDNWLNLFQSIQLSADCGNIRAMYDSIKKAFGRSATKTAPLKSAAGDIITDRRK